MNQRRHAARVRDAALAASVLRARLGDLFPSVAVTLGSGLSGLADTVEGAVRVPYADLPGFPQSGVSGHAGAVVAGRLDGTPVIMLAGREHYYERGRADAMRGAIEALAGIGVSTLMLTNAAGSLEDAIAPGEVLLIEDHIALGPNPLIGEPSDSRFVNMVDAYDPRLREMLRAAAEREEVPLHAGVYMWFTGPSFETPAEIRMAMRMGAQAVGMSTVPECILARHAGLRVAAASVITNYGAGMTGAGLSHDETKEIAPQGGEKLARILRTALPEMAR